MCVCVSGKVGTGVSKHGPHEYQCTVFTQADSSRPYVTCKFRGKLKLLKRTKVEGTGLCSNICIRPTYKERQDGIA